MNEEIKEHKTLQQRFDEWLASMNRAEKRKQLKPWKYQQPTTELGKLLKFAKKGRM